MKKAFLYAYDKVNLGDDLFVRTIVNRYPQVQFFLWADRKNREVFRECKNLKIIDKNSGYLQFLKKIRPSFASGYEAGKKKKSDVVIYIGGSIFMEYPSWKDIVNWWKNQAANYPFYVLGANFGTYQTEEYRAEMEKVFQNMKDVCFRDQYSKKLFEKTDRVRQAPDILFSLPMPKIEKKKRQIVVSVVDCEKKENGKLREFKQKYEDTMAQIMEHYLREGYEILLVSFCQAEGDENTVKRLAERFAEQEWSGQIRQLMYDGTNHEEILYELAAGEGVIATRFHAIILSLVAEQAVYPILYSAKSQRVLKDLGFSGNMLDIKEMEHFQIEQVQENLERWERMDLSKVRQESERHFQRLDQELGKNRGENVWKNESLKLL